MCCLEQNRTALAEYDGLYNKTISQNGEILNMKAPALSTALPAKYLLADGTIAALRHVARL